MRSLLCFAHCSSTFCFAMEFNYSSLTGWAQVSLPFIGYIPPHFFVSVLLLCHFTYTKPLWLSVSHSGLNRQVVGSCFIGCRGFNRSIDPFFILCSVWIFLIRFCGVLRRPTDRHWHHRHRANKWNPSSANPQNVSMLVQATGAMIGIMLPFNKGLMRLNTGRSGFAKHLGSHHANYGGDGSVVVEQSII